MDWFRYYTNTLESRKIQGLPPVLFKAWINILCVSRIFDGVIPPDEELAYRLRVSEKQAAAWVGQLKDRHLIDALETGELAPHDWEEHQKLSDDEAARKRKQRNNKKFQVTGRVPGRDRDNGGTCRGLEQNRADTDTEQRQNRAESGTWDRTGDMFRQLWDRWPRKTGMDSAARDWVSVVTSENEAAVFACADRYLASAEVREGKVRNLGSTPEKTGWLIDCARDGWGCDWPRAVDRPPAARNRQQENADAWSRA